MEQADVTTPNAIENQESVNVIDFETNAVYAL